MHWPAIAAARAHDPRSRMPLWVDGERAGSVARAHLAALQDWQHSLRVTEHAVELRVAPDQRDAAWAGINQQLRARGLIRGWRDELIAVPGLDSGRQLAAFERAAARFWGTLTLGAHANGFVVDGQGAPTALWVATRSLRKPTDPGRRDNLVGGGVALGQTPHQALVREAWEEAGLRPARLQGLQTGRVIRLCRDIPEGLQLEDLHVHDLPMPQGLMPLNQDGEVQRFDCLPLDQALALAAGDTMTVDASLVTLDFALRLGLVAEPPGLDELFRPA